MRGFTFDRDFYYPNGARKVADKNSDAVVYLSETNFAGKPGFYAVGFAGKRKKPDFNYRYRDEAKREEAVKRYFEGRQKTIDYKNKIRDERKAAKRGLDVGDVLYASWGYDQTNIDYYQVTGLIGKTMVEVRPIAGAHVETPDAHWMTGRCTPDVGNFTGDAMRKVARNGHVTIDSVRTAHKCAPDAVHSWTAYH